MMYQSTDQRLISPTRPASQSAATRSPERAAYSIFHEAWWLDSVAPGAWGEVQVAPGDGAIARWPFTLTRRWGMLISSQPPLTRTLGPVMKLASGKQITDFRRRLKLTRGLINQLPQTHFFQQTFDPRINEAVAFRTVGFTVNTAYTFRIAPTRGPDDVWTDMTDKTRNVIRRAAEQIDVSAIDDPEQFCAFYGANLAKARRPNIYGAEAMCRLTAAFMARSAGVLLGARMRGVGLVASIALVWDSETTYFLLSTRSPDAHSGAISLLLWHAIRQSLMHGRGFDFDGIASASILQFLSGFGGTLAPRLVIERSSLLYDSARLVHRVLRRRDKVHYPI